MTLVNGTMIIQAHAGHMMTLTLRLVKHAVLVEVVLTDPTVMTDNQTKMAA